MKNLKIKIIYLISSVLTILCSKPGYSEVLFEGYSKITLQGQVSGFIVQRFEFEPIKKNFVSTSFIQYNDRGGSMTESLHALANEALEPISYTYQLLSPNAAKSIEGITENRKLKLKITTQDLRHEAIKPSPLVKGMSASVVTKKEVSLPKGSFFSVFLPYVILKNPMGLKLKTKYEYQAVAEESGELLKGKASVQSKESYKNIPVFKVSNEFHGAPFIAYLSQKGEVIGTLVPQKLQSIELVASPIEATQGILLNNPAAEKTLYDSLQQNFGLIPEGRVNALSALQTTRESETTHKVKSLELQAPVQSLGPGKQGTLKGHGIQTKGK